MPLLIILIILIILYIIIGVYLHYSIFKNRFSLDSFVKTYTKEQYNLLSKEIEVDVDGSKVRGFIYNKETYKDDTLIIVCHGMWCTHKSYMQDIGYFCENGYQVLSFDYIGTDLSDGDSLIGFGQNVKCLDNVIKYVKEDETLKNKKIYLYGHSWGGHAVTNVVKFQPSVEGIIALAPATSFAKVLKGMTPFFLWPSILIIILIEKIKLGKYGALNAKRSLKKYESNYFDHTEILHNESAINDDIYKKTQESIKVINGNYYCSILELIFDDKVIPTVCKAILDYIDENKIYVMIDDGGKDECLALVFYKLNDRLMIEQEFRDNDEPFFETYKTL